MLGEWADSQAPVYCRDAVGRIVGANPSFLRRFGRPPADLIGAPVVDWLHPEDAPGFLTTLEAPPGTSGPESSRTQRWQTPQGWRWFTWEETRVLGTEEAAPIVRAVGRDITRQRLAEELYVKLSRAVDQSPVAIVITDAGGRVQYVNPRFVQSSGLALEDIIDRNIPVLREGHASDDAYRQVLEEVRRGGEWRGELSRPRADGAAICESVQISCMRNSQGEVTNLLCMREDITEQRRLQDELRQAQKMESLGTLAGGIAHDFNNLLAVMSGYADISLLHGDDPALLQRSLKEIKRAVQRASGLVRRILTFSRKAEAHFSPLDANQLVRDLVTLLAETFPRTVTIGLDLRDGLPPLLADQNQMQQIVLNLCVNARDAMPSGGTITVSTSLRSGRNFDRADVDRAGAYVCLSVADTGAGMTPEVRARIFEPFFTTKEGNKGTGLGLAVVYGIVVSHRGFIEVESAPGRGSTFQIFLPAAETAAVDSTPVTSSEFPDGTEALLVVDDEDPLRKLLETALTRKGYRITAACDGLEAIDLIKNPGVELDAVLLDLNMPGASGLAVLKVIKEHRPRLRVMILSGHLSNETRAEFEQLGQRDFMSKPYTLDELGRRLRRLLDATPVEAAAAGV
ncbi:MAG: ATP-binding protein [Opitutaceae bacterium]